MSNRVARKKIGQVSAFLALLLTLSCLTSPRNSGTVRTATIAGTKYVFRGDGTFDSSNVTSGVQVPRITYPALSDCSPQSNINQVYFPDAFTSLTINNDSTAFYVGRPCSLFIIDSFGMGLLHFNEMVPFLAVQRDGCWMVGRSNEMYLGVTDSAMVMKLSVMNHFSSDTTRTSQSVFLHSGFLPDTSVGEPLQTIFNDYKKPDSLQYFSDDLYSPYGYIVPLPGDSVVFYKLRFTYK